MDKFFKGAVFGAAVALAGAYLLGTEKGKETCKKVVDEVDKLKDELKSKLDETLNNQPESSSSDEEEIVYE
ncbi:MAG: YtxH domain-containing protein [Paludibacteraceae bacterium]|nr:YtxH domain-containing protein [Paludibacteraceae bacterium]